MIETRTATVAGALADNAAAGGVDVKMLGAGGLAAVGAVVVAVL